MKNTLKVFAEKKMVLTFLQQNINVCQNTIATTVTELVINDLVKLTMLWTTGPGIQMQSDRTCIS